MLAPKGTTRSRSRFPESLSNPRITTWKLLLWIGHPSRALSSNFARTAAEAPGEAGGEEQREEHRDELTPSPGRAGGGRGARNLSLHSVGRARACLRPGRVSVPFYGPDGTRCAQRTGLEIDHEKPFALFRTHDERYLRVLCRRHNQFSAEQAYGAEFIRGKIDERQRQRVPEETNNYLSLWPRSLLASSQLTLCGKNRPGQMSS